MASLLGLLGLLGLMDPPREQLGLTVAHTLTGAEVEALSDAALAQAAGPPAQAIFDTTDLSVADWLLATAVASTVLLLQEARKLAARLVVGVPR